MVKREERGMRKKAKNDQDQRGKKKKGQEEPEASREKMSESQMPQKALAWCRRLQRHSCSI